VPVDCRRRVGLLPKKGTGPPRFREGGKKKGGDLPNARKKEKRKGKRLAKRRVITI